MDITEKYVEDRMNLGLAIIDLDEWVQDTPKGSTRRWTLKRASSGQYIGQLKEFACGFEKLSLTITEKGDNLSEIVGRLLTKGAF